MESVGTVEMGYSDKGKSSLMSYNGVEGRETYWCVFQPSTKPVRVNSPIVGAESSLRTARTTTSSSLTPTSPKYRIEPLTPIVSGSWAGSSKNHWD